MHSQLLSEIGLVVDKLSVFPRVEAGVECLRVQSHVGGEPFQLVLGESALVLSALVSEEVIMKIPVFILVTSALGGFGCPM